MGINSTSFGKCKAHVIPSIDCIVCNDLEEVNLLTNKVLNNIFDPVEKPEHYNQGIEVIEVIEAYGLDYCLGNTVKYVCRAGKKDPTKELEDLNKAIWYLKRRIKQLEESK